MVGIPFSEAGTPPGASFDSRASLPGHLGDRLTEYRVLNEAAGLAWCPEDSVELLGNDRAKFLHNFCTNEIVRLPVGHGCEAFFLTAKGKVFDYGRIYSLPNSLWIEVEHSRGVGLVNHLERFLFREDVRLFDRSATHVLLHLGGPSSREVLESVASPDFEIPDEGSVDETTLLGVECQIRGRARSVHAGFDLLTRINDAPALWTSLLDAGAKRGLAPVGQDAMETVRVEASLPRFGREITPENLPQEIGRDSLAISFHKGCYIGQETVARLDAYGHVNRLLRGLVLEGQAAVEPGQSVTRDGKAVGILASVVSSPRLQKTLGLAVLRTTGGEPGSTVTIVTPDGLVPANVVELPFSG